MANLTNLTNAAISFQQLRAQAKEIRDKQNTIKAAVRKEYQNLTVEDLQKVNDGRDVLFSTMKSIFTETAAPAIFNTLTSNYCTGKAAAAAAGKKQWYAMNADGKRKSTPAAPAAAAAAAAPAVDLQAIVAAVMAALAAQKKN